MNARIIMRSALIALLALLVPFSLGWAEERELVSLNGTWDFYADDFLLSKLVKRQDEGGLSKRLSLDGQTWSTELELRVDCAAKGYYTQALVQLRAYASCDRTEGAFIGVRANGGQWVYTDVADFLDGREHWVPLSLNTADLVQGTNQVEICSTLHGKVYAMGYEQGDALIPGVRIRFCAPQDAWSEITVPSAFESQMSNMMRKLRPADFDGVGYYRKTLALDGLEEGESWWLCFQASDYRTEVWLNGRLVGSHEGGYTPFAVNLNAYPECVNPGGENELLVRVTDQYFGKSDGCDAINIKETLAGFLQDTRGMNYGGIWGDVTLEKRRDVFADEVFFEPDVAASQVLTHVTVQNTAAMPKTVTVSASVEGQEYTAAQQVEVPAHGKVEVTLPVTMADVRLWSLETPELYTGKVTIADEAGWMDSFQDTFGMRSLAMENGKIVFNGQNIFLTGVLHWGMYWDDYTPACSVERVESEIRQLKEAGFNTVKYCAVLPPDYILDVYDRMGMYVYIEYPIWEPTESEDFFDRSYVQMMDMVKKDRNHPCLVASDFSCELWSYSFEMEELLKWCVSEGQRVAPNRLFSDASSNGQHKFGDFATSHPYYQQNGFKEMVKFWTEARNAPVNDPAKYSFYGLSRIKSATDKRLPVIFGEYADTKVMRNGKELKATVDPDVAWYYDSFGLMDAATLLRRSGVSEERIGEIIEASIDSAQEYKRAYIEMTKQSELTAGLFLTHITDLQNGTAFGLLDDTGAFRFDAEAFRQAAAETALLLDCDTYNYWAGGAYTLGAEISYYGTQDVTDAALTMTLTGLDGQTVQTKTLLEHLALAARDYHQLCDFTVDFPASAETARYELCLTLTQDGETLAESCWKVWAYPKDTLSAMEGVYVYDPENLYGLLERYPWMQVWEPGKSPRPALLISTGLDDEMLSHVEKGSRMIYLGAFGGPMSASVNWNYDRSAMAYLPDERIPIVADLYADGYGGLQFNDLMTIAQLNLPTNCEYRTIIGKFNYDAPYLSAYMAEAKVGNGWLLQSTLRHDEQERYLESGGNLLNFESMQRPAGENALGLYLLDEMVAYMMER